MSEKMTACYPIVDLMEASSATTNGASHPREIREHLARGCKVCDTALEQARRAVFETAGGSSKNHESLPAWMSNLLDHAESTINKHKEIEKALTHILTSVKDRSLEKVKKQILSNPLFMHPHAVAVLSKEAAKYFRSAKVSAENLLEVAGSLLTSIAKDTSAETNTSYHFAKAEHHKAKGALNLIYGDYDAALKWLKQAEDSYALAGDEIGMAAAKNNQGVALFNRKRYDEAMAFYAQVEEIAARYQEVKLQGHAAHNIGNILQEKKEWRKALEKYDGAFRFFDSLSEKFLAVQSMAEKGNCLSYLKHPDAEKVLREAAERFKDLDARESYARDVRHLGQHFARIGQGDRALGYYHEALQVFEQEGAAVDQSLLALDMARLYLSREDYDLAVSTCRSAIPALEKQGLSEVREAMAYISEALRKKQKPSEVLGLLEKIAAFIRDASTNPALKFSMT